MVLIRYAFLLVAVVLTLASGFRLKNPHHVYPKGDPLEKSLAHHVLKNTKVVSGEDAAQGQFPYQIRLVFQVSPLSGFLCGGSLISNNYVLTAGHCVDGHESEPSSFFLNAGEIDANVISGFEQVLTASRVIKHEEYNSTTVENDIALLQTSGTYTFNSNVGTICVPPQGWSASGDGIVSGWGKTSGGSSTPSSLLQFATVTIINDTACQDIYGTVAIRDNDICTGRGPQGQNSCNGDSGGPLAVAGLVAGIVSRGAILCNDASIFTETSYYTDWIAQKSGVGSC